MKNDNKFHICKVLDTSYNCTYDEDYGYVKIKIKDEVDNSIFNLSHSFTQERFDEIVSNELEPLEELLIHWFGCNIEIDDIITVRNSCVVSVLNRKGALKYFDVNLDFMKKSI